MINIEQIAPFQNTLSPYEHFHVPSDEFIQHPQTGANVKTVFCRRWIEKTEQIIRTKPSQLPFCKIVALLSVPQFWSSQIIIFYSRSYYDSFWIRNGLEQFWKPIDNEKVSLNEGSIEDFQTIPSIGITLATRIYEYKQLNGEYKQLEDIMNVSGIKETIFNKIKDYIIL